MAGRPSFGLRLIIVVLLAVVAGFVWAMFESGRTPADFLKFFSSKPPEKPPETKPTVVDPKPEPPKPPPKPEPPKPEPPKPPPKPEPASAKATPRVHMISTVQMLMKELDSHIHRGRFEKAAESLAPYEPETIPAELAGDVEKYRKRISTYVALLKETHPGMAIEVPQMWRLFLKTGGKLVVINLKERDDDYAFETITGIRSRMPRKSIENIENLNKYQGKAEVEEALKEKCRLRGIQMEEKRTEFGREYDYSVLKGKEVKPIAFFDMADFCARHGVNDRLYELFDEGLKRNANLLQTVHDVKADRMIDVFLYFVSIRSKEDAKFTRDLLVKRYSDTDAFRTRIDKDVEEAYQVLIEGAIAMAPKPAAPQPKTSDTEPKSGDTPPDTEPPSQPEPQPASSGSVTADDRLSLPEGAPKPARDLCAKADGEFLKAMEHIRNSDPNVNRDGWAGENKKALVLLKTAFEKYNTAQDEFQKSGQGIPQVLLNRARETLMLSSMCRKRAVSVR